MSSLFIIGEKSTHANKVKTLNIRRKFSTTRRLNLNPESAEHIRPVINSTTKGLIEDGIQDTVQKTFEETGRILTREKAALIIKPRDLTD